MSRRSWDASSKSEQKELVAILPYSVEDTKGALGTMLRSSAWSREATEAHASGYVLLLDPTTFEGDFLQQVLEKLDSEDDVEVEIDQLGPFNVPNGCIQMFSCNGAANQINRQDFESIMDTRMFVLKGATEVVQQTTKDRIDAVHYYSLQLCRALLDLVEFSCRQASSGVTNAEQIVDNARLAFEVVEQVSRMNFPFSPFAKLVQRYSDVHTEVDRVVRNLQVAEQSAAESAESVEETEAKAETVAAAASAAEREAELQVPAAVPVANPFVGPTRAERVMLAGATQAEQLQELASKGDWEGAEALVNGQGVKDPLLAREMILLKDNQIGRVVPDKRTSDSNSETGVLAGAPGQGQLPTTPRGAASGGHVGDRPYTPAVRTAPLGFEQEPFVNSRGPMHGRITVCTTTHTWLEDTVRDCRAVRELLDTVAEGVPIQECDMGSQRNASLRDVMRSHGAGELPQVFFGKYHIGGLAELKRLNLPAADTQSELQSLLQQFVRSSEWEEVLPSQLVYQEKLGVGASGEVRAALWHGNPWCVI
jgi:glutaredoxin